MIKIITAYIFMALGCGIGFAAEPVKPVCEALISGAPQIDVVGEQAASQELVDRILKIMRGGDGGVSEDVLGDLVFTPLKIESPLLDKSQSKAKRVASSGYELLQGTLGIKTTITHLQPPPNILKPGMKDRARGWLAKTPVAKRFVSDPLKNFVAQYQLAETMVSIAGSSIQAMIDDVMQSNAELEEFQKLLTSERFRFEGVSRILAHAITLIKDNAKNEGSVIEGNLNKIVIPYLLETRRKAISKADFARKGTINNLQIMTSNGHAITGAKNTLELSIPLLQINFAHMSAIATQDALRLAFEAVDEAATASTLAVTSTLQNRSQRLRERLTQGPIDQETLANVSAIQEQTLIEELKFQTDRGPNLEKDIQILLTLKAREEAALRPLEEQMSVMQALRDGKPLALGGTELEVRALELPTSAVLPSTEQ